MQILGIKFNIMFIIKGSNMKKILNVKKILNKGRCHFENVLFFFFWKIIPHNSYLEECDTETIDKCVSIFCILILFSLWSIKRFLLQKNYNVVAIYSVNTNL